MFKGHDAKLLSAFAKTQDFEAFAELVRLHAPYVYAAGLRMTGEAKGAERVAEACFTMLAKSAGTVDGAGLAEWLHYGAIVESGKVREARNKGKAADKHDEANEEAGGQEQQAWRQMQTMLDPAMDEVRDDLREVLIRHFLQGRTIDQMAGDMGVEQDVIGRKLAQGVADLGAIMLKGGFVGNVQMMQSMLAAQKAGNTPQGLLTSLGNLAVKDAFWIDFVEWMQNSMAAKLLGIGVLVLIVGGAFFYLWRHRPNEVKAQPVADRSGEKDHYASIVPPAPTVGTERGVVEGVPVLHWNQSGQTTFCGALAAALAPSKSPVDYQTLMGVSGLAFRTRWYHGNKDQPFAGSCSIGEQVEERELAGRAIGKKLDVVWLFGVGNPKRPALVRDIAASIDAHVPVLSYVAPHLDMAVIYGYEDWGRTLRVRDYYEETPDQVPATRVGGFYVFLRPANQPALAHRESLVSALSQGVKNFSRVDHPSFDEEKGSVFFYGAEAYEQWTADIDQSDKLSASDRKRLFDVSNWNFNCLNDARRAAVVYLKSSALKVESASAKQLLLNAAAIYDQLATLTARPWVERDVFLGPWSGKTIGDWTTDVRGREIAMLKDARKLDEQAIAELKNALSALSATK